MRKYNALSTKKEIGQKGEQLACTFLEEKAYRIVAKNWRYGRAELDIIAWHGKILVFVEVKSRSYDFVTTPEEAVSENKEKLIAYAAGAYMESIKYEWEVRFDIISVIIYENKPAKIIHYEDVWF